jgi:hypothetical protein
MENKKLLTEKASPNPPVKIGKLPPELYNQMSPQQQKDYDFLYSVYGDDLYTNKNQYIPNSIKPIVDKLMRDQSFVSDVLLTQDEMNKKRQGLSYKEPEFEFETVPFEELNQMERDRRAAIDKRKTDLSSAISDQQKQIEAALQRQREFEAQIKKTQDILSGKLELKPMQQEKERVTMGPEYVDPTTGASTRNLNVPPSSGEVDVEDPGYQDFVKKGFIDAAEYEGMPEQIRDIKGQGLLARTTKKVVDALQGVLDKAPPSLFDRPEFDRRQPAKAEYNTTDPDYTGETARGSIPRTAAIDYDVTRSIPITAATDDDATQGRKTSTNKSDKPREPIYPGSLEDIMDVLQGTEGSRGTPRDKDWSEQLSDILRGSKGTPNIPTTAATDDDATKGGQRETLGTLPDDMKGGFLGQVRKQKAIQALTYEPSEAEIDAAMERYGWNKKTPTARERVFGVGGDVTTTEWYKQKQTSDAQRQNALDDLLSAQNRLKAYRLGDIKSFGAGTEQEKYLQREAQRYGISSLADVPEDKRVQAYGNIFAKAAREYSESGINKEQIFNDVLAGKYSDRFTEGMSKGFQRNPEAFARNYANRIAREQMKERKDEFKKSFRGTQYDPYVGADEIAKRYEYQVPSQPEVGPPDPNKPSNDPDYDAGIFLTKNLRRAEKARSNTLGRGPSQEEQMFNFWNDSSNANYQADMLRRRLTADAAFAGQFQMQTGIAGIDAVKMSNRELNDIQKRSLIGEGLDHLGQLLGDVKDSVVGAAKTLGYGIDLAFDRYDDMDTPTSDNLYRGSDEDLDRSNMASDRRKADEQKLKDLGFDHNPMKPFVPPVKVDKPYNKSPDNKLKNTPPKKHLPRFY